MTIKQIEKRKDSDFGCQMTPLRKLLFLSRKKLKRIDEEEELFKSVLITNTVNVLKKKIKYKKKKKNKQKTFTKNQREKRKSSRKLEIWKYKMRLGVKRKSRIRIVQPKC